MSVIYVLLLRKGKYYVGKTDNLERRLKEHRESSCEWVETFSPFMHGVLQENGDGFDEDMWTKKLMGEHGIVNVRGGVYTFMDLDDATMGFLEREIRGAQDTCLVCGKDTHYVKECKMREWIARGKIGVLCYICHRKEHIAPKCYAKTDVYGHPILK